MIRRDYILRMIEQCVQALTRSLRLAERGQFDQARSEVDQGLRNLAGLDVEGITRLSESDLLALLLQGEPTQALRQKCMLVVALLHRAGDLLASQQAAEPSRACYLTALNLQLEVLLREGPFDFPEFVPKLEVLAGLAGEPLPVATSAGLMRCYETLGQFGKAEDVLFRMLDADPGNEALSEFGAQFYSRILGQTDEALELGNLPRAEAQAGLAELSRRRSSRVSSA